MATQIIAGNATDGLRLDVDNTGALQIKTGAGAGTTAIDIDASQNVVVAGSLTATGGFVGGGGNYVSNAYTSPTSWDVNTKKAAGLKAVKVTVLGGGGDGGAVGAPNVTNAGGGGGGGGGTVYYAPSSTLTPSPTGITITAGPGTNSFGGLCSATGGSVGGAGVPPGTLAGAGGAGGVGSGGYLIAPGIAGSPAPSSNIGGAGGAAALIQGFIGGAARPASGAGNPATPTNYGGGGGGAAKTTPNNTPYAGGAGAPGVVIVEEFY
jgi:hypothetical protein